MSTQAFLAPNARRCNTCDRLFPAADVDEREVITYAPDVHDRPSVRETCTVDTCPFCGSEDLESASLCEDCLDAKPQEGSDLCASCENRAEAAYERSQSEGFRGGEAAAYLAEEQARIQREFK